MCACKYAVFIHDARLCLCVYVLTSVLCICHASSNLNVEVSYSTASEYFQALRADAIDSASTMQRFPVLPLGNDFFPYADNKDSYWTGYYVTRPLLKVILLD